MNSSVRLYEIGKNMLSVNWLSRWVRIYGTGNRNSFTEETREIVRKWHGSVPGSL